MRNETILKLLNEGKIEELKQQVMAELSLNTSKNKSEFKALVDLSKRTQKDCKKNRPQIAGAFFNDNKTYICNGYFAIIVNENLKNKGLIEVEGYPFEIEKVFEKDEIIEKMELLENINYDELNNSYKINKINKQENYNKVNIEGCLFDWEVIKPIYDCFRNENTKIYLKRLFADNLGQLYFKDKTKTGLVLGLRS